MPRLQKLAAYSGVVNHRLAAGIGRGKPHERARLTGSRRVVSAGSVASSAFFKLNFILILLVPAILACYIFLSNFLVSQKYVLGLRKQQFNQLSAKLPNGSMTERGDMNDLLLFAQVSGMIEAKDIGVILEESGVALSGTVINPQGR